MRTAPVGAGTKLDRDGSKLESEWAEGVFAAAATAASHLGVSRARLYQLRSAFLRQRDGYAPTASGGDRRGDWPPGSKTFFEEFLPLQNPPNYQLVADELERLCAVVRARSSVEVHVKAHHAHLVPAPQRKPRVYRRFRRARIGELWQHDSCIHQWWPAASKQTLLLTVDDHSGLNLAGRFVASDTTWNHFEHFRSAFEIWGLPEAVHTDALSLFGPSSTGDHRDPRSEFQRALRALGVAHPVAPTPQAKGKIERRFGTFQKRLVTILAHAGVSTWEHAGQILQMEIARQNRTVNRQSTDPSARSLPRSGKPSPSPAKAACAPHRPPPCSTSTSRSAPPAA